MNRTSRPAVAVAALALSTSPLLLAVPAAADTSGSTKAGIEYAERQASGGDRPNKAQIEKGEREQGTGGGGGAVQEPAPSSGSSTGTNGTTAWQLALSAALGAGLTGGVVVASRQVSQRRQAVAH